MKKLIIRIVGSVCILCALAVLLFPSWIKLDGISRKDLRSTKNLIEANMDELRDAMLYLVSKDNPNYEDTKDILEDYNLPSTKSAIKKRFNQIDKVVDSIGDASISFADVLTVSTNLPDSVQDISDLLEAELISADAAELIGFDLDEVAEEADALIIVCVAVTILLILVILLGIAGAVTHSLRKFNCLKYIFLAFIFVALIAVCFVLPAVASDALANAEWTSSAYENAFSDASVVGTAAPYFALILAAVPIVLDAVFELKQKRKECEVI